jgi:hypothetical protein
MYACERLYIHIHICTHVRDYTHIYIYMHVRDYTCIYTYVCMCEIERQREKNGALLSDVLCVNNVVFVRLISIGRQIHTGFV